MSIRRLVSLTLAAALGLGAPAVQGQDRAELTAMAERITAQSDALASLWPGYWPQQQPFILYAPDTGAVFGGAASPQGITYQPGALAGANFGFVMDFPSGVDNTIMLEVTGPDVGRGPLDELFLSSAEAKLGTVVHLGGGNF